MRLLLVIYSKLGRISHSFWDMANFSFFLLFLLFNSKSKHFTLALYR